MNGSDMVQKFQIPHKIVIWLGFLVVCGIFAGYTVLLRKNALTIRNSELQYLRTENAELTTRLHEMEAHLTRLQQRCPEAQSADPATAAGNTEVHAGKQRSFKYTVQKGDTIWDIAAMYNVDAKALMRWNNLTPRSQIFPGDTLTIILEE